MWHHYCLKAPPSTFILSNQSLLTIEPIDHWAYWPSSRLTIKPINHQAHWPSSLSTSGLLLRLLSLSACFLKLFTRNNPTQTSYCTNEIWIPEFLERIGSKKNGNNQSRTSQEPTILQNNLHQSSSTEPTTRSPTSHSFCVWLYPHWLVLGVNLPAWSDWVIKQSFVNLFTPFNKSWNEWSKLLLKLFE